ncbi:hypothetical protein AAC387_Pa01g1165 [Persea americana]
MSMIIALPSKNIYGFNLLSNHGARNRVNSPSSRFDVARSNRGGRFFANHGMQWGIIGCQVSSTIMHAFMGDLPGATPPPTPNNFPTWASWLLGTLISLILPIWKLKGGFLRKIGNTVEEVVETVEDVAEVVEDVAEAVEHISSDVADSLPGSGALKNAALWVENASKEVAEDAKQALDIIHKVDDLKEEVEKGFEELVESQADGEVADKETPARKKIEQKETQEQGKEDKEKEENLEENEEKKTEERHAIEENKEEAKQTGEKDKQEEIASGEENVEKK